MGGESSKFISLSPYFFLAVLWGPEGKKGDKNRMTTTRLWEHTVSIGLGTVRLGLIHYHDGGRGPGTFTLRGEFALAQLDLAQESVSIDPWEIARAGMVKLRAAQDSLEGKGGRK